MDNTPRRPICTIIAAVLPIAIFAALAIFGLCYEGEGFAGYGLMILLFTALLASVFISLILSVVALIRNERLGGLALIELFFYLILCLIILSGC
jgi:hypothetical protein